LGFFFGDGQRIVAPQQPFLAMFAIQPQIRCSTQFQFSKEKYQMVEKLREMGFIEYLVNADGYVSFSRLFSLLFSPFSH
jgi:hypothetical protein